MGMIGSRIGMMPLRIVQAAMFVPFVPFVVVTGGIWFFGDWLRNPSTPGPFEPFDFPENSTIGVAILKDIQVSRK
jgi:hypothetical protein